MVDKVSSTPLYVQIQDLVYDRIRTGALPPGARVPSEPELADEFAVSRMTARKALEGLVNKGYLIRRQGKGTYVADGALAYDMSTMLSFSGTLRSRGYDVTTRVLAQDVIPAAPSVAEKLLIPQESDIVLIRRLRLLNGRPAAIHTSMLEHRIFAPILDIDLATTSLLAAIEEIIGTRIAYTKDSGQAAIVSPHDVGLLKMPEGGAVLSVDGVAYTELGQPIRVTKAIYRGDLFRFVITSTGSQGAALRITDIL
jgi:GntR family transcriptional regulator